MAETDPGVLQESLPARRHDPWFEVARTPVLSTLPSGGRVQATCHRLRGGCIVVDLDRGRCPARWWLLSLACLLGSWLAFDRGLTMAWHALGFGLAVAGSTFGLGVALARASAPRLHVDPVARRLRFVNFAHRRLPPYDLADMIGWQYCRGLRNEPSPGSWQVNLVLRRADGAVDRVNLLDTRDRVGLRELLVELSRLTDLAVLEHAGEEREGPQRPLEAGADLIAGRCT